MLLVKQKIKKKRRNNMLSSRKKSCYFKRNNIHEIDYKDTRLLNKFVNDQGKITPRRVTGTSSKMHRKLVTAIKRARNVALLPFAAIDRD
jgi:small subunit ribosomal protein S18